MKIKYRISAFKEEEFSYSKKKAITRAIYLADKTRGWGKVERVYPKLKKQRRDRRIQVYICGFYEDGFTESYTI